MTSYLFMILNFFWSCFILADRDRNLEYISTLEVLLEQIESQHNEIGQDGL